MITMSRGEGEEPPPVIRIDEGVKASPKKFLSCQFSSYHAVSSSLTATAKGINSDHYAVNFCTNFGGLLIQ